jgi:NAD(P)-dependent dehydrogenase (short-subunit alcohol dehydrogenase family)
MGTRPAALVTGARRGIGRGIATALAARGFDVVVSDIGTESADETLAAVRAHGVDAAFVPGDVADVAAHEAFSTRCWDAFGGIECVVNNAGVSVKVRGDLLETDLADFDRVMAINLRGPFFLTIALAKRMAAEKAPRGSRSVINISSANATIVAPDRPAYALSKTGVSMMTKMFAVRLAEYGIAVHEIRPGIIRTDMTAVRKERYDALIAQGLTPIARWGEPADVGRAIAALACGDIPFTTGDAFHIDGGLHIQKL